MNLCVNAIHQQLNNIVVKGFRKRKKNIRLDLCEIYVEEVLFFTLKQLEYAKEVE